MLNISEIVQDADIVAMPQPHTVSLLCHNRKREEIWHP